MTPLKIGAEIVGGMKIGTEVVSALKIGTETAFTRVVTPVDRPGTLTATAVAGGTRNRGADVTVMLVDPDGIRSITSATSIARDGQTRDFTSTFARVDANTFSLEQIFNNARWRSASVTVTYVDGNGVSATLTANYAV